MTSRSFSVLLIGTTRTILFYLDILEAVGPYRNIYMGSSDTIRTPYPCLLVYKRCGRDEQDSVNWDEPAFLLPCRP